MRARSRNGGHSQGDTYGYRGLPTRRFAIGIDIEMSADAIATPIAIPTAETARASSCVIGCATGRWIIASPILRADL